MKTIFHLFKQRKSSLLQIRLPVEPIIGVPWIRVRIVAAEVIARLRILSSDVAFEIRNNDKQSGKQHFIINNTSSLVAASTITLTLSFVHLHPAISTYIIELQVGVHIIDTWNWIKEIGSSYCYRIACTVIYITPLTIVHNRRGDVLSGDSLVPGSLHIQVQSLLAPILSGVEQIPLELEIGICRLVAALVPR